MIKKLENSEQSIYDSNQNFIGTMPTLSSDSILGKINELVDTVNAIQKEREAERFEIQEWIGILEAVRKSVNIHEKQIDEIQMKLEPEKCKTPTNPYAEQLAWIGKLCKFWNDEDEGYTYDILIDIEDDGSDYPYKIVDVDSKTWTMSYKHCEPVPENLIYKGDDNEQKKTI
jgi:hypothetical protein